MDCKIDGYDFVTSRTICNLIKISISCYLCKGIMSLAHIS